MKWKIIKRASACAIELWAKRTRACDVRAAENRVCECACVRGKKSSQLTALVSLSDMVHGKILLKSRSMKNEE